LKWRAGDGPEEPGFCATCTKQHFVKLFSKIFQKNFFPEIPLNFVQYAQRIAFKMYQNDTFIVQDTQKHICQVFSEKFLKIFSFVQ
jgi:hypothetical protein